MSAWQPQAGQSSLCRRDSRDVPVTTYAIQNVIRRRANGPVWFGKQDRTSCGTLACRLVENGAHSKEVADVLRHRSLETSRIYAGRSSTRQISPTLRCPGRGES